MIASPAAVTTTGEVTLPARSYRFHGLAVDVACDVPVAAVAIDASFGAFALDPRPGRPAERQVSLTRSDGTYRLTDASGRVAFARTEQAAVVGLFDRVVRAVVDGLADRGILAIHAGAVVLRGQALLLAGPSGAGKSTLTMALMRNGASWLTDELAVIDRDGRTVLPFPRSLHVRPDTVTLLPELAPVLTRPRYDLGGGSEFSLTPADALVALGSHVAGPTPLGGVVLLHGTPGAGRTPHLAPVGVAVAAMELAHGAPAAAEDLDATLARLIPIVAGVRRVRLTVGDPGATAHALDDWLAAP